MTKLDERIIASMDLVLENVCRGLPNSGGDHATRKYVAQKLIQAAKKGNTTLGGLEAVGRRALQEIAQGSTTARAEHRRETTGSKQSSFGERLTQVKEDARQEERGVKAPRFTGRLVTHCALSPPPAPACRAGAS